MIIPQQRIFLSHHSKDHDFCIHVVNDLRRILGNDDAVWYDARGGIPGGNAWWQEIEQELKVRQIFIVILSPDSVVSTSVNEEIDIAWRRQNDPNPANRIRIVPVLYRLCQVPMSLKSLPVVNTLPSKSYETALQEILTALGLPSQSGNQKVTILDSMTQNSFMADVKNKVANAPPSLLIDRPEAVRIIHILGDHTKYVHSVALSTNKLILASTDDRMIRLWNPQTRELLRVLNGHTDCVHKVALSADGLTLANSDSYGKINLWNTRRVEIIRTLSGHTGRVLSMVFSADGRLLASSGEDNLIQIWNVQTGDLLHTLTDPNNKIDSITLSADGLSLASSTDKTIKLWNTRTGQLLRTLSVFDEMNRWRSEVNGEIYSTVNTVKIGGITLSADGLMLISGIIMKVIVWGVKE